MEMITNAKCQGVFVGDYCGNPVPDFDADEQGPDLCETCREEARSLPSVEDEQREIDAANERRIWRVR